MAIIALVISVIALIIALAKEQILMWWQTWQHKWVLKELKWAFAAMLTCGVLGTVVVFIMVVIARWLKTLL